MTTDDETPFRTINYTTPDDDAQITVRVEPYSYGHYTDTYQFDVRRDTGEPGRVDEVCTNMSLDTVRELHDVLGEVLGKARTPGVIEVNDTMTYSQAAEIAARWRRMDEMKERLFMADHDTRLSVATNAAAWVLHHGYDDEDDTSAKTMLACDEQIRLAEQIAQRVLRHIDVGPDQEVEPIRARGPIHEALADVEEALRDRTWPPTGAMCRDMADVIRRALQEIPFHHDECDLPEGHVAVPIAALEALRNELHNEGSRWATRVIGATEPLVAYIPDSAPWEPDPDTVDQLHAATTLSRPQARSALIAMHDMDMEAR